MVLHEPKKIPKNGGKYMLEIILGIIIGYAFRDFIGFGIRIINKKMKEEVRKYERFKN